MSLAANALTTTAALEGVLGITPGSATARCEQCINAASESIERHCGRKFGRAVNQVDNLAGHGTPRLYLDRNPVESVASVVFDGVTIDPTDYQLFSEGGYVYRDVGWAWTASAGLFVEPMQIPGTEKKVIAVTYTGGYALAGVGRTPGTYLQPYDLEEAALALAAFRYRQTPRNPALASEQAGNAARAFGQRQGGAGVSGMPDYISEMLEPYVRIR